MKLNLRLFKISSYSQIKQVTFFWFFLSFVFPISYASLALREAFKSPYIVQDDARQHIFWMQRFLDPNLFPNDLIADYFQSVAPVGYTFLYKTFALLGVEPLIFNKVLALFLIIITNIYCFRLCLQILPLPITAFLSSFLLNQTIWLSDDLVSGTPRAFTYVLILAFLYYIIKRALIPCIITLILQGLLYPQIVLISLGIFTIQLFTHKTRYQEVTSKNILKFSLIGIIISMIILLIYGLKTSDFAPVITAAEARQMPEFLAEGRSDFFNSNWLIFWIVHHRSGFLPRPERFIMVSMGIFYPLILRYCNQNHIAPELRSLISRNIFVLLEITIVSFCLFFMAHLWLFRLHLPSRYTQYTLRIVLSITTAIVLTILIEFLTQINQKIKKKKKVIIIAISICLLIAYPHLFAKFPRTNYQLAKSPHLYNYLQQQPKNIMIASISKEADFIPIFAQRSVLVNKESAIPYHLGYYRQFRQKTIDLIKAQYSDNSQDISNFIRKYNITFWLLDLNAFDNNYLAKSWIQQYQPITKNSELNLQKGVKPVLNAIIDQNICLALKDEKWFLIDTKCLVHIIN